jgi:Ca-activated chloride channel family protein
MLEFEHIWAFVLLPLPLAVWWLAPPHRETVSAIRVPFFASIATAIGGRPREGSVVLRRRVVQMLAGALTWGLLIVALAGPQWAGQPIERTETARDVILAIDLSGSMDQRDFAVEGGDPLSRLDAVKHVVGDFIDRREGDRVGLIVFGTRAYVQVPFTRDLATAKTLLEATEVAMAGPHTAIGDAIGLAIRTFEASEVEERLLILLTDGADTGSRMTPLNAAEIAAQNAVRIIAIGAGDPAASGEDRVDFDTLQEIADKTEGRFFSADDAAGLEDAYAEIDRLEPQIVKTVSYRPRQSLVHYPAGAAFVLVFATLLGLAVVSARRAAA